MKPPMRTLILFTALIIMFCACKKENSSATSLTGKWKLVQSKVGTGGPGQWVAVPAEQSTYVQFDTNGKLQGTAFTGYSSYIVKDSVTLVFSKDDSTKQNYRYSINNGLLDMSPTGPIFCVEGCTYRFSK